MGDEELRRSYDGFEDSPSSAAIKQAMQLEERVAAEIGPGLFDSDDFEVLQQLGRISVMKEDPGSGAVEGVTAVIAYAARFLPRLALQRPLPVLLKEHLPVARAVAYNELLVVARLAGLPEDTYAAANKLTSRTPPVVPLLGYFTSAPTEEAASLSMDAEADSVWLVYRWEGLKPLNMFLDSVQPPQPARSFFKKKEVAEAEAWAARHALLRTMARGLVSAVAYCHSKGVVHGSLSPGTVYCSSLEDAEADLAFVKIDNFGFGRLDPQGGPLGLANPQLPGRDIDSTAPQEGRRHDMQAAALTLLEVFAAGTAASASPAPASLLPRQTLVRLLFSIYPGDVPAFRDYCAGDERLARLVAFLDAGGGAGWDLLGQLLAGERPAGNLLVHPFLGLQG